MTAATLDGTTLTIEIESGASVSVDLSSMLTEIYTRLDEQDTKTEDLQTDVALLQTYHEGEPTSLVLNKATTNADLYQNMPNRQMEQLT